MQFKKKKKKTKTQLPSLLVVSMGSWYKISYVFDRCVNNDHCYNLHSGRWQVYNCKRLVVEVDN